MKRELGPNRVGGNQFNTYQYTLEEEDLKKLAEMPESRRILELLVSYTVKDEKGVERTIYQISYLSPNHILEEMLKIQEETLVPPKP